MKTWLRIFFIGGAIAYRGLFNWIRPYMYIPTMLGSPLFQILFFTYLGRYANTGEGDAFFVVGNAIQVCSMSAVYAMTMAVANERQFGTLGPLLATPANRGAIFLGRALPVLANGIIVSAWGFLVGRLFTNFDPPLSVIPAMALVVVVSTFSCTAFGLVLGTIGLRGKDFFFAANLAYYLLLLFCGVNIPLSVMPGWMADIGRCLPLTHGIAAGRELAAGASLGSVAGLIWTEFAIGLVYGVIGFFTFRLLELESRRTAVLDSF